MMTTLTTLLPRLGLLALLFAGLSACSTVSVSRVDSSQEIALTDKWNDKDSQLTAEAMIEDMLTFPWIAEHMRKKDRRPTVIIQRVRNKSHEHIATDTFTNDLKRALLRSGKVDFVADSEIRKDIRAERADQELNASSDTQAQMGEETGADYALSGTINSTLDELDGKRVTAYQIDLRLIDMSTNREAWNGQKKIKKLQERSKFGF
ncbi:penicillin-binding protein activator LpoB [Dasania sp. GY-MA-18]|uniref:Penicillin-binding protein activator LpoB n=1 Tax=Dasania phycosphaerae TaxID=2950436 RepID=A0A9J6RIN1_9GAMM|nr:MULTISPECIES: penicillin-binding protein activator LpoB [Dasania]MCR8921417.1 penicillin-binding protein activator LpoB [Dasania sp. GY-MA-18]MCZ0863845.1 penicillin-binding protein activator LpoB [Dasania phycosphaerae]MCZ0867573.1 penicillin-binding protein activator LpoB [Dasania phycosphaerae]